MYIKKIILFFLLLKKVYYQFYEIKKKIRFLKKQSLKILLKKLYFLNLNHKY